MLKIFASIFLFLIFLLSVIWLLDIPLHRSPPVSLSINILTKNKNSGAGKGVDISIIKDELEKLGHHVKVIDLLEVDPITPADVNIFLAQFTPELLSKAKLNWFIPNPEYCELFFSDLKKFDLILCKTKECLRIFQPISSKIYYLGFTSHDSYMPNISKNYSKLLHLPGQSPLKGTENVYNAWQTHPALPDLTIICRYYDLIDKIRESSNLKWIKERIPGESLLIIQNECGIHLCPSKTEGFGHYIMEAMSAEAVIITTDAPPMNEFISDERCLVKCCHTGYQLYGAIYTVDESDLANTVIKLQKVSSEDLQLIGKRNREEYLRRTSEFKQNFKNLLIKTVNDLNSQ